MAQNQNPTDNPTDETGDTTAIDVENRPSDAVIADDPLVSMLTPGSKVRILSALIAVGGEKLNPSAICDRAAISRDSWYDHKDDLETFGVIEKVDQAGNSPMYRVDLDDPLIKRLREARDLAAKRRNQPNNN